MSLAIRPPLHASGGHGGLRLPAEAAALWEILGPPWLMLAAAALCAGLGWRFSGVATAPPDLPALLNWAGFVLWASGPILLRAADAMQAARRRCGVLPAFSLLLPGFVRQASALLVAAAALAIALAGLLCSYRAGGDLLAFRDAELRLFSITLPGAVFLVLLVAGGPLALVSAAGFAALRRLLSGQVALGLWAAITLALAVLLIANGWAGPNPEPAFIRVLPGNLLADALRTASEASAEYVYYAELVQGLLNSLLARLACGLGLSLVLAWLTRTGWRGAGAAGPGPFALAAWSAALLPALLVLPQWWREASRPAGPEMPALEAICAAGVVAGWGAYLLSTAFVPAEARRRAQAGDWLWLLAPPVLWLLAGMPRVESALLTRTALLAAGASALALWLAGIAVLRLCLALGHSRRGGLAAAQAATGALLAAVALPLWKGESLPALSAAAALAAAEAGDWIGMALVDAALLALALCGIWAIERRPRPKVRARRADTSG